MQIGSRSDDEREYHERYGELVVVPKCVKYRMLKR